MKSAQEEQRERKALAGSTTTMTFHSYHSRALAELQLENQGRHTQGASVTGSKPAVVYPRQPENSPWAGDPVPNEEPYGVDISAQEPTGNYHEIEESLIAASLAAAPEESHLSSVCAAAPDCASPPLAAVWGHPHSWPEALGG
jgi:hypothetical protein